MKKILAVIIAILMVALTFVSCKKPVNNDLQVPDDSETQQQIIQPESNGDESNNENSNVNNDTNEDSDKVEEDSCNHEGGEDATCKTESVCSLCQKPYGGLDENNHEGEEVWENTASAHKKVYSCCGKVLEDEAPHTFDESVCSVCEYVCTDHDSDGHNCKLCKAFITHIYQNSECSVCGLTRDGKKITFGSYPQSKVTGSLVTTLNSKVGDPTTNSQVWTSYNYSENADMWYVDVEEGGEKYRGVYFSQYRPTNIVESATASNAMQDDNGYALNTVHWFKYEPITWTILEEDTSAKKALVLCDLIIDAQTYDNSRENTYEESTIRKWLNETFVEVAFDDLQREVLLTTAVDNGKTSTGYGENSRFYGNNTDDKVFLLSRVEIKKAEYGFPTEESRVKVVTEYAKSQGVFADNSTNKGWWWLRTPAPDTNDPDVTKNDLAFGVKTAGILHSYMSYLTSGGVVPAMWINI